MEIKTIGIIGAGTMGNGIAQVAALAGYNVLMRDIEQKFVDKGMEAVRKSLGKAVEKGKMAQPDADAALGRIKGTMVLSDLKDCDFIIEAVIENAELKRKVYAELDKLCPAHTIFASNTSSISITELAAGTSRVDRFIGMHFMNPVPLMKLVEMIRGLGTSDETAKITKGMAEKMGKTVAEVTDYPGFVSNRVLMPMINEAIYCLMEGVGSRESIDTVMKLGMNHPMGPLELADLVGLDVVQYILEVMYAGFGDPKYRPCPLLKKMVKAGRLGRKTGIGFYEYPKK
ncbi:MAG: 3-hydroxybutyryl-CoA dehydrogenase [Euryarchaeota archaeon]|nr:3-hydroxybutyryl-CoA dehydrogenase [Euryarchaeota archaeon]